MLYAGAYTSILAYLPFFLHSFIHVFFFLYFIKNLHTLTNHHTSNTFEFSSIELTKDSFYLMWDKISCGASALGLASRDPDLKICSLCTCMKSLLSKNKALRCGLSDQVKNVSTIS